MLVTESNWKQTVYRITRIELVADNKHLKKIPVTEGNCAILLHTESKRQLIGGALSLNWRLGVSLICLVMCCVHIWTFITAMVYPTESCFKECWITVLSLL